MEKDLSLDKCECVLVNLRKIIRAIDLNSKKLLKNYGLTGPQLLVLRYVEKQGRINPSEIAKNVSLSPATISSILDRLLDRNLIDRTREDKDKRKVYVALSSQGCEILKKAPTTLQESFMKEFNNMSDWEQSMVCASVERLVDILNAEEISASPVLTSGDLTQK